MTGSPWTAGAGPGAGVLSACVMALATCVSAAAAQPAEPPPRSSTADVVALTVCVIDADIRTAAIAQLQRGSTQQAALDVVQRSMPDRTYRAQAERLVAEVYRAQPPSLRAYVAERLQLCAANAARRVNPPAADGCYQLTRFANDFFAAREAGVPLENTVASVRQMAQESGLNADGEHRLAKLAASVYATTVAAPEFRAGLFFHCVMPPTRSR
jgi:hypothetical protein